jgi:hypothetical protein
MNAKIRTGVLILASSFSLLSGCISTSFQPAQNVAAPSLTPASPAAVRVLRSPPNEPFLTLGDIVLEITGYHSDEAILREAREQAAAVGADTIILTSALRSREGTTYLGESPHVPMVTFTAIRRLPEGPSLRNQ